MYIHIYGGFFGVIILWLSTELQMYDMSKEILLYGTLLYEVKHNIP